MSLHPTSGNAVPDDTATVARAVFSQGNACLRLRDRFGPIFADELHYARDTILQSAVTLSLSSPRRLYGWVSCQGLGYNRHIEYCLWLNSSAWARCSGRGYQFGQGRAIYPIIPTCVDYDGFAQARDPTDVMVSGAAMSLFQAWQHWVRMAS